MRRLSPFVTIFSFWAVLLSGCYEIPPVIPAGYLDSEPPDAAWPPPAVYTRDPFAPRNRWFQRGYCPRSSAGFLERVEPSAPLPLARSLTSVDCAELTALLEACAAERPSSEATQRRTGAWITDALFCSDALQLALVAAQPPFEGHCRRTLLKRLVHASTCAEAIGESADLPAAAVPPPLRQGDWLEWPDLLSRECLPSIQDLRWGRLLSEESHVSSRWILLRLRVGLGPDRSPRLLPLASECWAIVEEEGRMTSVVCWRFDRAEWSVGRDPWVPVVLDEGEEEPLEGVAELETDSPVGLVAASFRDSGGPSRSDGLLPLKYRPILDEAWRDVQRRVIQEVLDSVVFPGL